MLTVQKFRKLLGNPIKKGGYSEKDKRVFHQAYLGAGFTMINKKNIDKELSSYDLNSAYVGTWCNEKFPFDAGFSECEWVEFNDGIGYDEFLNLYGNDLCICFVNFKGNEKRFDVDYNTYFGAYFDKSDGKTFKFCEKVDGETYKGVMTSVDLKNLVKLYKVSDIKIFYLIKHNDVRELGEEVKKEILKEYGIKEELRGTDKYDAFKKEFNKVIYGKQVARDYQKMEKWGTKNYTDYIIIGLWIPAYIRSYMIDQMIENIDRVAYIDTDSIKLVGELKNNVGNGLGEFKCEWKDCEFYCARLKVYSVWKNGKLIHQAHSGVREMSVEEWEILKNRHKVSVDGIMVFDSIHESEEDRDERLLATLEDNLKYLFWKEHKF